MIGSENIHVHSTAIVEASQIGAGTRIWAFAHVLDGARIGQSCNICDHVYIEGGAVIGDRVTIKNGVMIFDGVTIESDAFVGPGVVFTNDHWPRSRRMSATGTRYDFPEDWLIPTRICHGASLGAGAVILCGITIGAYAMVGAGSVVTGNIEPFGLYAGNPARRIWYVCPCGHRLSESLMCLDCGRQFSHDCEGMLRECAAPMHAAAV